MHPVDDALVLGHDVCADGRRSQECAGLEAEVVTEAADGVGVTETCEEGGPDVHHQVADAPVEVGEEFGIVGDHIGQILVADQVLAQFQHAIAGTAQGFHARWQALGEHGEFSLRRCPIASRHLLPGIGLEVGPALDGARPAAIDGAMVREIAADGDFPRHRVVGHFPIEAAVLCEELAQIGVVALLQTGEARAQNLLHDLRTDLVLIERQARWTNVPQHVQHVAVVRLEGHRPRIAGCSRRRSHPSTGGTVVHPLRFLESDLPHPGSCCQCGRR